MLSLFKKTVLSVAMLGCAFGMHAEKKAASSNAAALATGAMVVGGAGIFAGLAGIEAQLNTVGSAHIVSPTMLKQLLGGNPYMMLIPGAVLALGAAIYCFKESKGFWKKTRSIVASALTVGSGAFLASAYMVYMGAVAKNNPSFGDALSYTWYGVPKPDQAYIDKTLKAAGLVTLGATAGALTGYMMQPKDNSEKKA